jgi:serine/threonine-protein kinase RsbW
MHWYEKAPESQVVTDTLSLEENTRRTEVRTAADVFPLYGKINDLMWAHGFQDKDFFFVRLALHEALSNALLHGNGHDAQKVVRVQYLVNPDEITVEIRDQGPGFDPAKIPDPLDAARHGHPRGWGVFLMRTFTSWISFNREGNQVTLGWRRTR